MNISIAVGSLACEPPNQLQLAVATHDASIIASVSNPRRRRELLWSRGLKANLVARLPTQTTGMRRDAVPPTHASITHDRHFAAVALSKCGEIGIDLQTDRRLESCRQIAETWFPNLESAEILASGDCARFLLSWVIKETWAKIINRSIFETCRSIGIWKDQIHITDKTIGIPRFAWARHCFQGNEHDTALPKISAGFAMGICLKDTTAYTPSIECFVPDDSGELHHFAMNWEWLSIAESNTNDT